MLQTILWSAVLVVVFVLLIVLRSVVKELLKYLKSLSDKHLTETINLRIHEAYDKLERVVIDLLMTKQQTLKRLALESIQKDGFIDYDEVKSIAKELGSITVNRMQKEKRVFVDFISGDDFVGYVEDKISAIATQSISDMRN